MEICEIIEGRRGAWAVYSGLRSQSYDSPESLAGEFGLRTESGIYFEVDEMAARSILTILLHRDMAYESEVMPRTEAEALANSFIDLFRNQNCRYFSNGNWHASPHYAEPTVLIHPGWTPATDATFDGGIIALGEELSGCVWFEDED